MLVGGGGPPLLLLHGYPQTHVCWHKVAPILAQRWTVVCPDLRGYGDSVKPQGADYSKRAMAVDQIETMTALGFEQFAVAGHDRGGRVAYRLALDHPERVSHLAVLDIIPTIDNFERLNGRAALGGYHWLFLAQPAPFPERLIGADPDFFLDHCLQSWAGRSDVFDPEAMAEYHRCFRDPATIHATCEDYRANPTIDYETDEADRGRRMIGCPVLVLWGAARPQRSDFTPLDTWQRWASNVRGRGLPCGHFLPEELAEETAAEVERFLLA